MNRENQKGIFVLAAASVAMATFLSVASPALSRDEHEGKDKEAAA